MADGNITKDSMYGAVPPDDFESMLHLDRYNALTTAWLDDPAVGVARITSRFVMKPVRHFAGYPLALLAKSAVQQN